MVAKKKAAPRRVRRTGERVPPKRVPAVRKRRVEVPAPRRAGKAVKKSPETTEEKLTKLAVDIAGRMAEIKILADELETMQATAQDLMMADHLTEFRVKGTGTHSYLPTKGRKSTKIDLRKYLKAVGQDIFFETATVTLKAAEENLPKKTINQISEEIPAQPGPPTYKFKPE